MLPIRDFIPTRRFPVLTVGIIVINVVVFFYELLAEAGGALEQTFYTMGMVPFEVTHNFGPAVALSFITAMFLHGGFMHIFGNMLYLWIFGNNVEDSMGRLRFLVFYLTTGIIASITQVLGGPDSRIPTVGASGAIAGVLGAYIVLFPTARVQALLFLGLLRARGPTTGTSGAGVLVCAATVQRLAGLRHDANGRRGLVCSYRWLRLWIAAGALIHPGSSPKPLGRVVKVTREHYITKGGIMTEQGEQKQTTEEREDIGRRIEAKIREAIGGLVGAEPTDDWETIGRRIEGKIRTDLADLAGAGPEADWDEIGQRLESHTKGAVGNWAGAEPDDDWDTVGRKMETKIRAEVAKSVGVQEEAGADWERIGQHIEARVKAGLGKWAGAEPEDDWETVGRKMESRIKAALRGWLREDEPAEQG